MLVLIKIKIEGKTTSMGHSVHSMVLGRGFICPEWNTPCCDDLNCTGYNCIKCPPRHLLEHLIPELWSCSDLETLEMTQSSLLVKYKFVNVKSKIWELN